MSSHFDWDVAGELNCLNDESAVEIQETLVPQLVHFLVNLEFGNYPFDHYHLQSNINILLYELNMFVNTTWQLKGNQTERTIRTAGANDVNKRIWCDRTGTNRTDKLNKYISIISIKGFLLVQCSPYVTVIYMLNIFQSIAK